MEDPQVLLGKLIPRLDQRVRCVGEAEDWYEGEHPIPEPPPNTPASTDREARAAYLNMSRLAVTNFLRPIVDVRQRRLNPEGFQFSLSPTSTDSEAWDIYRRNHLDGDSDLAHHAALKTGQAFAIVWPGADGKAEITIEDPSQVIVAYEPGSRRKRMAALKRWVDDDGYAYITLYTRTAIYKYRSTTSTTSGLYIEGQALGSYTWAQRQVPGEQWPLRNPYGVVPVFELRANPSVKPALYGGGTPEFAGVVNEQRKINHSMMLMLVAMEHQSFRQRWVTGWDYPTNPDGTPDKAAMVAAGAARLLTLKPYDGQEAALRVGEFAQADFRPFVDINQMLVTSLASNSGTPPYAFLLGNLINVASDAMARLEGIQADALEALARSFGETWSDVIRFALLVEGNDKAKDPVIATVWGEFERRTATEQANLALQAKAAGAPIQVVFSMFPGVDPTQAKRWKTEAIADELRAASVAPAATVPGPPVPPTQPTPPTPVPANAG